VFNPLANEVEEARGVALLLGMGGVGGIERSEGAMALEAVADQVEAARPRGEGGEAVIPAAAVHLGSPGVGPEGERRRHFGGVRSERVSGDESEPGLEARVAVRSAFPEDPVEGAAEVVRGRAAVAAPVGVPQRARIGGIDGGDQELHRVVDVVVAGHGAGAHVFRRGVPGVVSDQVGPAGGVGVDEPAHDGEAGAGGVAVLAGAGLGAVGDEGFDVPFVGVEEEADEGLLVVGIAAGIRFDGEAQA
jgi:hypothetical protein